MNVAFYSHNKNIRLGHKIINNMLTPVVFCFERCF